MDGTWLAVTGGGPLIEIRDPATGNLTCAVNTGTPHGVEEMAVAPDATWVATASPRLLRDQVLRIWDLSTGELRHAVDTGHRRGVEQVVVAPDGTWLATADFNWSANDESGPCVQAWDTATGHRRWAIETAHPYGVGQVAVAPDSAWLATIGRNDSSLGGDPVLRIWDADTGVAQSSIDTGHRRGMEQVVVSPDGTWLGGR